MLERPLREKTDIRLASAIAVVAVAGIGIGLAALGARLWFTRELRQWQQQYLTSHAASSAKLPAQPRLEPLESHSAQSSATFALQQREQEATLHRYGRTG